MQAPTERALGVCAAGASCSPAGWYGAVSGDKLVTYGLFGFSWAELIQILGAAYIAVLMIKGVITIIKWARGGGGE